MHTSQHVSNKAHTGGKKGSLQLETAQELHGKNCKRAVIQHLREVLVYVSTLRER